jgi:hypothetical protein
MFLMKLAAGAGVLAGGLGLLTVKPLISITPF